MDLFTTSTVPLSETGVSLPIPDIKTGEDLVSDSGVPVALLVVGSDSKRYRLFSHKAQNRRLKSLTSGRARKVDLDAEEIERDNIALAVHCVIGWTGLESGGQPVEFSKENVERLFAAQPYIRELVSAFIEDRVNFLERSASS